MFSFLIVRTALYDKASIAKVIQLRANVEDLKLGEGVLDRLAEKGANSSLRYVAKSSNSRNSLLILFASYALQLLTPASILASLAGRKEIQLEDINEMGELFLDAKTSAQIIGQHKDGEA